MAELLASQDIDFQFWVVTEKKYIWAPKWSFKNLFIIDIFNGREPILIDNTLLTLQNRQIGFRNTLLLDSNVVGHIIRHFQCGMVSQDIQQLLTQVAKLHGSCKRKIYDINPAFYILEAFFKDVSKDKLIDPVSVLVIINHLDNDLFLRNNELKIAEEDKEALFGRFRSITPQDIALKIIESICIKDNNPFIEAAKFNYFLLLKLCYIIKQYSSQDKLSILERYINFLNDIGILSARELILGIFFLNKFFMKFAGFYKQNKTKLKKALKNTSWDLLLLKIPELTLQESRGFTANLVYPITFEKELFEFSKLFHLVAGIKLNGISNSIITVNFKENEILEYSKAHFEKMYSQENILHRQSKSKIKLRQDIDDEIKKLEKIVLKS